jgi:predicted RNase H-like nuclease (RuvC/YqgF family)
MGRKVSLNERSATEALRGILDSTKNEKLRMKAAQLLLDNEIRNKDRAVARQRHKLSNTQKKELEKLRKQVDSLQKQLQSAQETITSLTAANKQEAARLNRTIHALEEDLTKARAAASQAEEHLSSICILRCMPRIQAQVLIFVFGSTKLSSIANGSFACNRLRRQSYAKGAEKSGA